MKENLLIDFSKSLLLILLIFVLKLEQALNTVPDD